MQLGKRTIAAIGGSAVFASVLVGAAVPESAAAATPQKCSENATAKVCIRPSADYRSAVATVWVKVRWLNGHLAIYDGKTRLGSTPNRASTGYDHYSTHYRIRQNGPHTAWYIDAGHHARTKATMTF